MSEDPRPQDTNAPTDDLTGSSDKMEPVELLADDFVRRQRAGENPTIEEYCQKHPELADEIRDVFPALLLIEQVAPAASDLKMTDRTLEAPDHRPIEKVGDYRILREIGRGGMGVVYEAEQESLGRRVALKVLPRQSASDEKSLLRFQREARAAAKLHHTNIVPVFDVGQDKEYSYYAMQLIQGQGLDHVIKDLLDLRSQHIRLDSEPNNDRDEYDPDTGRSLAASLVSGHFHQQNLLAGDDPSEREKQPERPSRKSIALTETLIHAAGSTGSASLPGESEVQTAENNRAAYFRSVAEIGRQCARALSYAHARGITHRDIKPSNLLLDTAGVLWVTDFGLAHTTDSSMTQTGDILGTLRYMSPERFKGQCDNRADVYSLGLTLYELLVLKPAFESPDRIQLINLVTSSEIASPRTIDSRIPRDLETIVLKAADKDPKRRYQSADDLADDLRRFLNDEPILARRVSPGERFVRWSRRNPWLATAGLIAALALIAVTVVSGVAARTQANLNERLGLVNDELKVAAEEERKLNEQLHVTNASNEALIGNLKRSQSRLAEKQADFIAEKGDIAESMLWLARSYELTQEDDSQSRQMLLTKLQATARDAPRLIRDHVFADHDQMSAPFARRAFEEYRRATSRPPLVIPPFMSLRNSLLYTAIRIGQSPSVAVLAIRKEGSAAKYHTNFHCFDLVRGSWTGQPLDCEGIPAAHDFLPDERWLATVSYVLNAPSPTGDATRDSSSPFSAEITEIVLVRHIDTGEIIYQSRQRISRDGRIGPPPLFQAMSTGIRLKVGGDHLIRTFANLNTRLIRVQEFELRSGEIVSDLTVDTWMAGRRSSPLRGIRPRISRDGKRLFTFTQANSSVFRNTLNNNSLLCFDVETGSPVSQPSGFSGSTVLLLSDTADRVAIVRGTGDRRRIHIHDVETGEQIGESIELDEPASTSVQLCSVSGDGTKLLAFFLPTPTRDSDSAAGESQGEDSSTPPRGYVRVFDLAAASPITPHVPTSGMVQDAIVTERGRQLIVRDARGVRSWQLPAQMFSRTLIPVSTKQYVPLARGGATSRLASVLPPFETRSDGRLLIANKENRDQNIRLETWDGQSGKLKSVKQLPNSSEQLPVGFSTGGEFLLTALEPSSEELQQFRDSNQTAGESAGAETAFRTPPTTLQRWNSRTGQPIGEPIPHREDGRIMALSADGKWLAIGAGSRGRVVDVESGDSRVVPGSGTWMGFDEQTTRLFVLRPRTSGPQLSGRLQRGTLDLSAKSDGFLSWQPVAGVRFFPRRVNPAAVPHLSSYGTTTLSSDGRFAAGLGRDSKFVCVDLDSNQVVFAVEIPGWNSDPIFGSLLPVAIDAARELVFVAGDDGFIRRIRIPERWDDAAETVMQRVVQHTGIRLGDNDEVELTDPSAHRIAAARDATDSGNLSDEEVDALQLLANERWSEADNVLRLCSETRPDDPLPWLLSLRPLLEQQKLSEADQVWQRALQLVDRRTAGTWLETVRNEIWASRSIAASRTNQLNDQSATTTKWINERMLQTAVNDSERAGLLFESAKAYEVLLEPDLAVDAIDEAVKLEPDSPKLHYYRAHLMARLGSWSKEIESRRQYARLDSRELFAHYRLVAALLDQGTADEFWDSWRQSVSVRLPVIEAADTTALYASYNRDLIARTFLVAGGPDGPDRELALRYADANDGLPEAEGKDVEHWFKLGKGLAEYRRDNWLECITILTDACEGLRTFNDGEDKHGMAIARFFVAMAHHHLGHNQQAFTEYLEGLDLHHRDRAEFLASQTANGSDWHLAEAARREAKQLIGIDEDAIADKIEDTSGWTTVLEERFDNGIGDNWSLTSGAWEVSEGAASGTLANEIARLDLESPQLPTTFELQYETWTSDPMLAACTLLDRDDSKQSGVQRFAMSSSPDRFLMNQMQPATGVSLMTDTAFGKWFPQANPDFTVEPGKRYQVRILRQPTRITVWVDDAQVLSSRVRKTYTPTLRFFAKGVDGTKVYLDNVKLRVPPSEAD